MGSSIVKLPTGHFVYQDGSCSDINGDTSNEEDEHERSGHERMGADDLDKAVDNYF